MQLYEIQRNGNSYCGPAVISAISGIGTKEAAALIRSLSGRERVRGTHAQDLHKALSQLGYTMKPVPRLTRDHEGKSRQTLRQWSKGYGKGSEFYLVAAGNHWILLQGAHAQCRRRR